MNFPNSLTDSTNGKKYLVRTPFHIDVVSFISKKVNIKPKLVIQILDLLVFALKKTLIENGKVTIYGLGTIYTRLYRKTVKRTIFYKHRVRTTNLFKRVLKGECPPPFIELYAQVLEENFELICDTLNLNIKDVKYLFSLFIYCITLNLLKYKVYRLRRFGYFYIEERPLMGQTWISKKWAKSPERPANTKQLVFRQMLSGWNELNKKTLSIKVNKKIQRMLYLTKIDRTTKTISPRYVKFRKSRKKI